MKLCARKNHSQLKTMNLKKHLLNHDKQNKCHFTFLHCRNLIQHGSGHIYSSHLSACRQGKVNSGLGNKRTNAIGPHFVAPPSPSLGVVPCFAQRWGLATESPSKGTLQAVNLSVLLKEIEHFLCLLEKN